MSDRALEAVRRTLSRSVGLRSDGASLLRLERALEHCAAAHGISPDLLADRLDRDPAELARFVDRITVQETSFFRHPEQFAALADVLRGAPATGRIWCAGCATGQEAWSVVMLLDELGLPGWDVVATDVSEAALTRARAATYDERELRGLDDARRARHLRPAGERFRVTDRLRRRVTFSAHNLTAATLPAGVAGARIVLCRNVLIYLDAAVTLRLLERLHALLAPSGVLVLGGTEALGADHPLFNPQRRGEAYVYLPRVPDAAETPVAARRPAAAPPVPEPPPAPSRVRGPVAGGTPSAAELVAEGERLLAEGDARGGAARFRQAAYVDPDDVVAHLSLGLALERSGSPDAARRAFRAARSALERCAQPHVDGFSAAEVENLLVRKLGVEG